MFWISGAAVAFVATAGAFLLLAGLGAGPSETRLESGARAASGPALRLEVDEDRLGVLEQAPDQDLTVAVANGGEEALSGVSVVLQVASENTAVTEARYYRATVEELAPGAQAAVTFSPDLSPLGEAETRNFSGPEPPGKILEIRAATPSGVSAVRTAILPP